MDPPPDALETLAGALRERLVERAGVPGDGDDPAARIARRSFGLGPLEPLLADPAVDEVLVNGAGAVFVERGGRVERAAVAFGSEAELRHAIERILAPLGRRVDEASPLVDARLPDGSRVNVVIPPLALEGPILTIRRFRRRGFSADELLSLIHI